VRYVSDSDIDAKYIEEEPQIFNYTISKLEYLGEWPKNKQQAICADAITLTGRHEMYYGRWFRRGNITGAFLLHDNKTRKTFAKAGDIEIMRGRKYRDNLDTSHVNAMKKRESIGFELLVMYAFMGGERIEGDMKCAAAVCRTGSRVKDPIRFKIVPLPDNYIEVEYPGFWNADAPVVIREDFLYNMSEALELTVTVMNNGIHHLNGSVDRFNYLKVLNTLDKGTGKFVLLGFNVRFVGDRSNGHWKEISEDKVSTLLPREGLVRWNGTQESWDISSQLIYTESENRSSGEFIV